MTQPQGQGVAPQASVGGLLRNSGALLGSRIVVAGLGWAGTILVVRRLEPAEFGRFAFVFSLIGLLSFATDLSSSRIMVRALAQPGSDRAALAGAYVVLRSLMGLATYVVAVGLVIVGGYPREVVLATVIVGLGLVVGAAAGALDAVFQAEVRMGHVALADVVAQSVQLALTVAVAVTRPELLLFVLPALAFDVVAAIWKSVFVRRLVTPRLAWRPALWRDVLRQAAPLAAGTALFSLSIEAPIVLLSKLDSFEAVARYGVALKFETLAAFLPAALVAPLLPLLVRTWPHDRRAFLHTVSRAVLLLTVAGATLIAGFVPVATDVVAFLYGADYREAGTAAAIAVFGSCMTFTTQVAVVVLITVGRHMTFVALGVVNLVATVTGTLLLVPVLGYEGAAVASAATAVLVAMVTAALAIRHGLLRELPVARMLAILALAGIGAGVGVAAAGVAPWPVAAACAVAACLGLVELTRVTGPGGLRVLLRDTHA